MQFDHIGLVTETPREDEEFRAVTKVWVTDAQKHPFNVEWLRFEPDSPVTGPVRTQPHVAFRVNDLTETSKGLKVLLEPFDVGRVVVGFYQTNDGAVIELMQYKQDSGRQPE